MFFIKLILLTKLQIILFFFITIFELYINIEKKIQFGIIVKHNAYIKNGNC